MKALVLIGFAGLFLVCAFTSAVFSASVGVWLFDEDSGNIGHDSSGNGNDGEVIGETAWVEGKFGNALSLLGTGYMAVPDSPTLNPTKAITMMMWINPEPEAIGYSLMFKDVGGISQWALVLGFNGEFVLIIQPGEGNILAFSEYNVIDYEGKTWQHLAGTFDSETRNAIVPLM